MTPSRRPDSFYALGVRPELAEALAARGITEPFPIQAAALPDALAGRDVLGRGRTGSGKTVAFALPLLERVLTSESRREPGRPRALVLVPTRELAVQVAETIEYLAHAVRLRTMTVFGGVRYTGQIRKLERGVDVVVATPGRLEDLIEQGHLRLDALEVVVLDEADLMADMGFMPPVTRILEGTPAGQRMLFSATLDNDVAALVKKFLRSPLEHSVDAEESGPDAHHYLFLITAANKAEVVSELLSGGGRTLAFMRTKFGAERLAAELNAAGITAVDLHGNLRQGARQRNLAAFADGSVSVLVATDIAARGIHVDDIGLVVHVDPPNDPKAFLHRSGRTARAGSEGNVVTLATKNMNKTVRALMGQAKIKPTQLVVGPGDDIISQVRAARIEPAASGPSIFTPDPEDEIDEQEQRGAREPRPDRSFGRRADRPERPAAARGERPARSRESRGERPWRDAGPGRGEDRPSQQRRPERRDVRTEGAGDHRPRRDFTERAASPRGPRPDWTDTRPRPERLPNQERPVVDRDGRDLRDSRPKGRQAEWSAGWWGPEPWEVEDRPARRPDRDARPARDDRPRRDDSPVRDDRPGRPDARPRPGREARAEDRERRRPETDQAPRTKNRWTADDRRQAAEAEARGFGFRKTAPGKAGKPAKAGKSPKAGKGKGKPPRDPDKGKPKRKPK